MEITTIKPFLSYLESARRRTMRLIKLIPPDKLEWTYKEGKFTLGDLVRHLATIERYMYAETVSGRPSAYPGCGRDLADGYDQVISYFETLHQESVAIFSTLTDEDLNGKTITPAGVAITTWKWLRAMLEHEAHHRGQIYMYLAMLEIPTPPIYGLTSEEVHENSISLPGS